MKPDVKPLDGLVEEFKTRRIGRREFIRKASLLGLSLTSIEALVAGCAPSTPTPESTAPPTPKPPAAPVTVSFWKSPHGGNEPDLWAEVIADFEDANPGIKIEYSNPGFNVLSEKLASAFGAGAPPDVCYMPDEWFPKYAVAGQLVPQDEVFADVLAELEPQFQEGAWNGAKVRGHFWGVPFIILSSAFWWNKDHFEEAGLDPDVPPDDWDEMLEFARRLTKKDAAGNVEQYGFIFATWVMCKQNYHDMALQAGMEFISPDFKSVDYNNPAGLAWVGLHEQFFAIEKTVPPLGVLGGDDYLPAFPLGKASMIECHCQMVKAINDLNPGMNYGVSAAPAGPGGGRNQYIGLGLMVMAEACKHKEEAMKWIQYCVTPEVNEKIVAGVQMQTPMKGFRTFPAPPTPGQDPEAPEIMKWATGFPRTTKLMEVAKIIDEEMEKVKLGTDGGEAVLVAMEERINPILDGT